MLTCVTGWRRSSAWAGFVAAFAAFLAGCASHRELDIRSDPPGASVRIDEKLIGKTPIKSEFEAFGTRRVTLYLEGYRAWSRDVELKAPWYAWFPFDLFSEVLIPVGWHFQKDLNVKLEPDTGPVTAPDLEKVLEEAEALRKAGPEGPRPKKTAEPPQ
jgi:hypothetical protein